MAITKREVLENLHIGKSVAEQETSTLARYFVETNQWRQCISGEVDMILGEKGSGKSAIYALIKQHEDELRKKNIYIIPAEKPQGQPAFRILRDNPPTNEVEFNALWKLYFLALIVQNSDLPHDEVSAARKLLTDEGLINPRFGIIQILKATYDYVRKHLNPTAIESTLHIDPISGAPTGMTGKIVFSEVSATERERGLTSVDELLAEVNESLGERNRQVWLLLDRLDVVFEASRQLERNGLRALFHVYKDFFEYENINLKIFIRTDIWKSISDGGFREASHLSNRVELSWGRSSLVNLVAKRLMFSEKFTDYYEVDKDEVNRKFEKQKNMVLNLFPNRMIVFQNKIENGFDWIIYSTRDGRGNNTPRDLIDMLNAAKEEEIARLERGEAEYKGNMLFNVESLHKAIRRVSRIRLEQTIYAEFPELRNYVERLAVRRRHRFEISDLQNMWGVDRSDAQAIARKLSEVGVFRVEKENHSFVIPHLYGYALGIGGQDPNKISKIKESKDDDWEASDTWLTDGGKD